MHVSSEYKIYIFIDSVYIGIDRQTSFRFKFNLIGENNFHNCSH